MPAALPLSVLSPRVLSRRQLIAAGAAVAAAPFVLPGVAAPDRAAAVGSLDRVWPTAGWESMTPAELGIDPDVFIEAAARIADEATTLSALVTTVGGRVVDQWYADGFTRDDTTDIWSSTKSVTSAATGIAIGEGLFGLDDTLGDLIPDRIPADADPGTAEIRVRGLLTMSSGWEWEGTADYANLETADDYAGRALSLPVVAAPGEYFTYNSANSHLLSVIIQATSGQTLHQYAQDRLFTPIGVQIAGWDATPQGETTGGWGLHLTPGQMAAFGYLMLNGGAWDGTQVVPADWVAASTAWQIDPIAENDFGGGTGYGYFWWLDEIAGHDAFFSLGYGESSIMVVPGLDLVMAAATARVPALELAAEQSRPRPTMRDTIGPAVAARP